MRRCFMISIRCVLRRRWLPTEVLTVSAIGDETKVVVRSGGHQQKVVIAKSLVRQPNPRPESVSRQGKVVEEFSALEATEEKIMYAAIH